MSPAPARYTAPHNLAACYQEMLSLAAQLATGSEIGAPERFRGDVRKLLQQSDLAAKGLGYGDDELTAARFAVISLIDDIILNSTAGAFLNWANNPLGIDIFHEGGAGVRFFQYLSDLLQKQESPRNVDVLEVYLLCLLLGFRGQFGRGHEEQLHAWREPVLEKLQRVGHRGKVVKFGEGWKPEAEIKIPPPPNERTKRVISIGIAVAALVPVAFLAYWLMLSRGVSALAQIGGH